MEAPGLNRIGFQCSENQINTYNPAESIIIDLDLRTVVTETALTEMKWDPSHAFLAVLISQVALHLVYPVIGEAWGVNFLLGIFLMLALYGGIRITISKPIQLWISTIIGVCFIAFYWIAIATDIRAFYVWSSLVGSMFFAYLASIMMSYIFFYRSKVDVDLIYGAISVYLLIGSAFAEVHIALALSFPGAFSGIDASAGYHQIARSLSYYSFVTLTTLGYGDITPQLHYARILAYAEAVTGQLYLTILVARLVGTYIAQSQKDSS